MITSHISTTNSNMKKAVVKLSNSESSKISELMSSIQGKLDMLARDDFEVQEEPYNQSMPLHYDIRSPQKKSTLHVDDLQKSRQSIPSSPILSKLSHIEQHYLSKLTVLNQKVAFLQTQNQELKQKLLSSQSQLLSERQKLSLLEHQLQSIVQNRLDELKDSMMTRLRDEVQIEVQGYIEQLKEMREELTRQRKEKKGFQKDLQLLRLQRDNYESMYRQMIGKYKMVMQAEVQNYNNNRQRAVTSGQNHTIDNVKKPTEAKNSELLPAKKRKSSKKTKSEKVQAHTMPKQQLIPFLTKGIQQLKEKLKLK